MTIAFTCPKCQTTTKVADSFAGQTGPCAKCGATITIPGGVTSSAVGGSSGTNTVMVVLGVCLLMFLVCGGGLAALLIPAVGAAREAARNVQCVNNLKQIALALHSYHDTHKTFPPAYIPDADGQPLVSWRVLILPFMEYGSVSEQYNFSEPWDSPSNLGLVDMPLPIYQCPSDPNASCSYFVVNMQGGIFDGPNTSRMSSVVDGTSNTIMVVEVTGSNVHWAEPVDLTPQALAAGINGAKNGTAISSNHKMKANVAFADGSVRQLNDTVTRAVLQQLINKKDGTPTPEF